MTKAMQSEREQAIAVLRGTLKPGDTVHTILRHCSRSGMQRVIDLVVIDGKEFRSIAYHAAIAMDDKMDRDRWGIKVSGCGMDMGFSLVYSLGRTLYPEGFAPSVDGKVRGLRPTDGATANVNIGRGRNAGPMTKQEIDALAAKGWKFSGRNGDASGWDNDGGYALKQRWL